MMKGSLHYMLISLLTIGLGAAWLLNLFPAVPNANWIWTMGLGLAGLLILAVCGFNKVTIVTGPFLIIAAIMSILRLTGRIEMQQEMPGLMIALGVLMLMSPIAPVPLPGWMYVPMRR